MRVIRKRGTRGSFAVRIIYYYTIRYYTYINNLIKNTIKTNDTPSESHAKFLYLCQRNTDSIIVSAPFDTKLMKLI